MIDKVSEYALKLVRDIDLGLSAIGFDLGKPFVTRFIQVLLEDVEHDGKTLVEEHVTYSFPLLFPFVISWH